MKESPFKLLFNWLFDGELNSEIPIDLLSYNSPITDVYLISMFVKHINFNIFLNEYMNNIGLRYIDKKELLLFIKKSVKKFNLKRNHTFYFKNKKNTKLFEILRNKIPYVKDYEINEFIEEINNSDNKDIIYQTLGLKNDVDKKKIKKKIKNLLEIFIDENLENNSRR